ERRTRFGAVAHIAEPDRGLRRAGDGVELAARRGVTHDLRGVSAVVGGVAVPTGGGIIPRRRGAEPAGVVANDDATGGVVSSSKVQVETWKLVLRVGIRR